LSNYTDKELEIYRECLKDIQDENFHPNEIEVMIRIYKWTKSDHNIYFSPQRVVHQVGNYRKRVRKLRARALIQAIKSGSLSEAHKITQDGQATGYIMLLLRDLDWL